MYKDALEMAKMIGRTHAKIKQAIQYLPEKPLRSRGMELLQEVEEDLGGFLKPTQEPERPKSVEL